MAQFAFQATDSAGNSVAGTVDATDMDGAMEQVRGMGYTPIGLQQSSSHAAAQPSSADVTAQPLNRAVDLTASFHAGASPAPLTPLGGEEAAVAPERLEPWQRGGPVEQPAPTPTLSLNAAGLPLPTAGGAAAVNSAYPNPPGAEVPRGVERNSLSGIPYGGNTPRLAPLGQRIKEVLIYPLVSGVVIKDLAPFYRQFGTLINAGLPLYQALVGLEKNTQNAKLKEIAVEGQRQVQAGGRFSDVMAAYPWVFQPMHYEMVRAAEQGGMLDTVLRQIAEYVEHEIEIRRMISRETFYPKMVLFVALMLLGRGGFSGGQMAIVGLVLGGMGKGTYSGTDYLMDTIGFGVMCLLPFVVAVAVFRLFLFNVSGVREGYDSFKCSIPGLGKLVKMFAVAKFMRTFAALYRGGFSMAPALEISGNACGNWVIRNAAHRAIGVAERGGSVAEALHNSRHFDEMAIDMFRTGEVTGNLDAMLDNIASFYEEEGKLKSHQLAMVFSVGVFLLVAALVGFQVISFYMGGAAQMQREMNQN